MFTRRKLIPPNRDLTYVEVKSHLGSINPFSYQRFVFIKWCTPFLRDLTQMRCLTWVGVFLLLNSSLKRKNSFCFSQEKLDIKVKTLEIFIRLSKINCEKLQDLTTKRLNQQNITMIYYTVKSKIGNRGNTAGKRKKHGRKP